MSIFEAKEYWSTVIANEEEFDGNSICIDNIDNDGSYRNKIIVSSFQGFLRIYEPAFEEYKNTHLLFEKYYDAPILQIGSGSFINNSTERQLAILQTKRLMVVKFSNLKGAANTKTCFEHKLPRNAFNFCTGTIGDKNHNIIFVQSVDGAISILQPDGVVNSIIISEIYLPGPIAYIGKKDCLLISNTSYEIECYAYNQLATTKDGIII